MSFTVADFTITVGATDSVSAQAYLPENPVAVFVFAHGAGANMHHAFMKELAAELTTHQIATLRYNFLYMEQKKKHPDLPAVAHKAVAAAINKAHELFPSLPVVAGGKSFGGRMTTQFLSNQSHPSVKGIVLVGFPLHPAGSPSTDRADHLKKISIPLLFLQGSRDSLATWNLMEGVCKQLTLATLIRFENADHSFKAPKQNLIPVLASEIRQWVNQLL